MAQKLTPARTAAAKKSAKKAGPATTSRTGAAKSAPKKLAVKKAAAPKKAAPKKAASKKATTKKATTKKAPAKVAPAKKAQAQKAPAKVAPAKKAAAKKAPAPKAPARKLPAKAPAKKAALKPAPEKAAAKKAPPAPPRPPVEEAPREVAPTRKPSKYDVGDKVVHPQHGAATIAKKVKREFSGEVKDYFVLDIATESLTVMVPIDKIDGVVRPVISKTQSRNVLTSLKEEPQEAGANWSRWYKVLTEKMYSGDINQVAEVVRDLTFAQQTKGISPALKRMLSKARMTLISELSFSLEVDEEEATRRLDRALPRVEEPILPPL
jgi:CarD family transcriptional regulator